MGTKWPTWLQYTEEDEREDEQQNVKKFKKKLNHTSTKKRNVVKQKRKLKNQLQKIYSNE